MLIHSPQEMFDLGKEYAHTHKKIALHGELWAGKTLFTKGFASGLGIDEKTIQSPTYTYINVYAEKLLHIDMYRLESAQDLIQKWIFDQIQNFDHIIIERPKFSELPMYQDFLHIEIQKISEEKRKTDVLAVVGEII